MVATAVSRQLMSRNASAERIPLFNVHFLGKRPALSASDVTFVTVDSVLGRILADVAGDALEAWLTAAWAVAVDTVRALQVAGASINTKPIKCASEGVHAGCLRLTTPLS